MSIKSVLYRLYEYRIRKALDRKRIPKHVGVILDGNRRWAHSVGQPASHGHKKGADKVSELLHWCTDAGVEVVTLWLLSTDNLKRNSQELTDLLEIICQLVEGIVPNKRWQMHIVGNLSILDTLAPRNSSEHEFISPGVRLRNAIKNGAHPNAKLQVNVAIGYGGREEIASAVRAGLQAAAAEGKTLKEVAESFSDKDISNHLYTAGQPEPDIVIRTSGEQRLSGFILWQSVHTEYYFCETYWPEFRRTDFLRAIRDYSRRERRLGK